MHAGKATLNATPQPGLRRALLFSHHEADQLSALRIYDRHLKSSTAYPLSSLAQNRDLSGERVEIMASGIPSLLCQGEMIILF